jgi:RNA polymerase sigma-70 factor (sigma-E family)
MLVALGAGEAGAVDQRVAVGAERDGGGWDDALVDLYRAQRLPLLRLAVLLTDDRATAEDVVQDAFLALQRRWPGVDPAAAAGYLRTSVVNGVRSLHRRRVVARRHLLAVRAEDEPPADLALLLTEDQREVVAALRTLPRRQREVLVLRYWSELSEAEIADALGIARGTVKSSASRALASLQRSLGDRRVR